VTVTAVPRQLRPMAARSAEPAAAYRPLAGYPTVQADRFDKQYQEAVPVKADVGWRVTPGVA
jgi:hypothetical protein